MGLIAANVLIFIAHVAGVFEVQEWVLRYDGFSLWECLASAFAHAGISHLVGNMVFLWCFGLIVERKLGTGRFLAVYAALAIVPNIGEQLVMMGSDGGSLGASTAIAGLMAMALVWAPHNRMDMLLVIYFRAFHFDWAVWVVTIYYIGWDFIHAMVIDFEMSTPVLHLNGVILGAPLAIWLLFSNRVDCEGWDIFSGGKRGGRRAPNDGRRLAKEHDRKRREEELTAIRTSTAQSMREMLADDDVEGALLAHAVYERNHGVWNPPTPVTRAMAEALWNQKRWNDFETWAFRLERCDPNARAEIELARAQLLIEVRRRPQAGLRLLRSIERHHELSSEHYDHLMRLHNRA
ncbi:MAG: rhomboid family intramembrane serine protease [Planctomycetota bacterium]|nr:rhomboid family intramembrane serine protease [Planctomycetota bacterium]